MARPLAGLHVLEGQIVNFAALGEGVADVPQHPGAGRAGGRGRVRLRTPVFLGGVNENGTIPRPCPAAAWSVAQSAKEVTRMRSCSSRSRSMSAEIHRLLSSKRADSASSSPFS